MHDYKHVRLKLSEETNELIIILYYVHYYPPLALGSAFLVEEKVLHFPPLALGLFLLKKKFLGFKCTHEFNDIYMFKNMYKKSCLSPHS